MTKLTYSPEELEFWEHPIEHMFTAELWSVVENMRRSGIQDADILRGLQYANKRVRHRILHGQFPSRRELGRRKNVT